MRILPVLGLCDAEYNTLIRVAIARDRRDFGSFLNQPSAQCVVWVITATHAILAARSETGLQVAKKELGLDGTEELATSSSLSGLGIPEDVASKLYAVRFSPADTKIAGIRFSS